MQTTLDDLLTRDKYKVDTYENIVCYICRDELIRILNGEPPVEVLPGRNQRMKLHRDFVLDQYYVHGGKRVRVHPRAERILRERFPQELNNNEGDV